jgi:hypothetical protein
LYTDGMGYEQVVWVMNLGVGLCGGMVVY